MTGLTGVNRGRTVELLLQLGDQLVELCFSHYEAVLCRVKFASAFFCGVQNFAASSSNRI